MYAIRSYYGLQHLLGTGPRIRQPLGRLGPDPPAGRGGRNRQPVRSDRSDARGRELPVQPLGPVGAVHAGLHPIEAMTKLLELLVKIKTNKEIFELLKA